MTSTFYKYCAVPQCKSTTVRTPNKLFIYVPQNEQRRKKWLKLARRDFPLSSHSKMYFCEDHFDLPNDMENYMQYYVMGSVSVIRMKKSCIPSKFDCHPDRRKECLNISEENRIQRLICEDTSNINLSSWHIQHGQQDQKSFSIDQNVQVFSKIGNRRNYSSIHNTGNKAGQANSRNIKVEIQEYVPQMNYCISNTHSRKQQSTSFKFVHAGTITENTDSQSNASLNEIEDIKVEFEELIDSAEVKVESDDPEYEDPQQIYCTSGNVSDVLVFGKLSEEIQTECTDAQQDNDSSHNTSEHLVLGEIKKEIKTEYVGAQQDHFSSDNIFEGLALGEIKEKMKTEFIDAQQSHCTSDYICEDLAFEESVVEEIKEEIKTECDDYNISTNGFSNFAGFIKEQKCDF